MNSLQHDYAARFFETCEPPCLTLYQPTHRHHPANQQDRIRFRNLVKTLEESLRHKYPAREVRPLIEPFLHLAGDDHFWDHTRDGLAVIGARGVFRVYRLQRPVPELAIVADTCHTKPLVRLLQSSDRYQVLGLSRHGVRLFEGTRDAIDEIALAPAVSDAIAEARGHERLESQLVATSHAGASAGHQAMFHGHGGRDSAIEVDADRLFRAIDRTILEHHSQVSGLPLVLATLPEHRAHFRRVSRNPHLIAEGIDVHPDALTLDALRERTWALFEPHHARRLASWCDAFAAAQARGLASDHLPDVAGAVVASRVSSLVIEADRQMPGRIDPASGAITPGDLSEPDIDDLLDDLGTLALKHGAQVSVVAAAQMPTASGVAAIYRF